MRLLGCQYPLSISVDGAHLGRFSLVLQCGAPTLLITSCLRDGLRLNILWGAHARLRHKGSCDTIQCRVGRRSDTMLNCRQDNILWSQICQAEASHANPNAHDSVRLQDDLGQLGLALRSRVGGVWRPQHHIKENMMSLASSARALGAFASSGPQCWKIVFRHCCLFWQH